MNILSGLSNRMEFTDAAASQVARTIVVLWTTDDDCLRAENYMRAVEDAVYRKQATNGACDIPDLPLPR